jgi:hypothetical protein
VAPDVEDEVMKAKRLLGALLTAALASAVVLPAADVYAAKKKDDAPAADPPVVKKAIKLSLPGITWNQSPKQVTTAIEKIIDDDYAAQYKEVQPGIKMKELDQEVAELKSQFARSRVDFGKLPTGMDSSPLRGEYTYNNRECVYNLDRNGLRTWFFFIQERLWKVIEEQKLNDKHPLGKTYQEAVVKMSTDFGVPGRVVAPDGTNRFAVEVDWKDATSHLRAIQRGETAMGLAFEDNGTLANLASLRTNKPAQDSGVDPDVAAALGQKSPEPGPPDPKKKK